MPFDFPNQTPKARPAKKHSLPVVHEKTALEKELNRKITALTLKLDDIQVAAPCDANWSDMSGDEQIRFCGLCSKNVYNFSDMSREAIATLLLTTEGRVCGRFYKREDGTLLTSDCPVGLAERSYRMARRSMLAAFALVGILLSTLFSFFGTNAQKEPTKPLKQRIEQTLAIKGEMAIAGGLRTPELRQMGDVAISNPPPVKPKTKHPLKPKTMGKIRLPIKITHN